MPHTYESKKELYDDLVRVRGEYEKKALEREVERVKPLKTTDVINYNINWGVRKFFRNVAFAAVLGTCIWGGVAHPNVAAEYIPFWNNEREKIVIEQKKADLIERVLSAQEIAYEFIQERGYMETSSINRRDIEECERDIRQETEQLDDQWLDHELHDASIYDGRGWAYFCLGDYERAIEDYNKAIEYDGNSNSGYSYSDFGFIYYHRGIVYYHLEDYTRAIGEFSITLSRFRSLPNYARSSVYYWRGNSYYHLGDYVKAIEDYNRAIPHLSATSSKCWAYYNEGRSHYNLGQYEEALNNFEEILETSI